MSWSVTASEFHFLRPAWLAALPLLWALALWAGRRRSAATLWSGVFDPPLLAALKLDGADAPSRSPWPWLALAWTLAVLALAGPSWQKDVAPAFRGDAARVIVLDLSPSMNAADLSPDRLSRARYAIEDLLVATRNGRVGLVAFADAAFTVTPLTDDAETVRGLLQALAPDLMPVAGDRLAPALAQAGTLLQGTPSRDRSVIVVSDGFADPSAAFAAAATLREQQVRVDVVVVGTPQGAPVPAADGGFVSDAQRRPLLARTDPDQLRSLARSGGGDAFALSQLATLSAALAGGDARGARGDADSTHELARWRDAGAWLLPPLLLLGALLSRRGWLP